MQFHFTTKDSVYTILAQLKKLPSYKKVVLSFNDDHTIFEHIWWGKQIKECIDEKHLQVICMISNKKQKLYFENCGITTQKVSYGI